MNIFILNTGRCGSMTFVKACEHIENYSAAHESRISLTGVSRLQYPEFHIEADNRLSWVLGRLDKKYADNAFYVHLKRNKDEVAESFSRRMGFGIMPAYKKGILLDETDSHSDIDIALDYIETVESNIEFFLKGKSKKIVCELETIKVDFERFWQAVDAAGNLDLALNEWDINYNASS